MGDKGPQMFEKQSLKTEQWQITELKFEFSSAGN